MPKLSKIYYCNNTDDRITVGMIAWDENKCLVKSIPKKLDMLKYVADIRSYTLFRFALDNFIRFYSKSVPNDVDMHKLYCNSNGIFQISKPSGLALELNKDNFEMVLNKLCDK